MTPRPPAGLYVHVPFCVSICPYCDFVVYPGKAARGPERQLERFVAALEAELHLRADALDALWGPPVRHGGGSGRPPLRTLYLGGGTPSLLPAPTLAALIALVRERYGLAEDAEVSLEANPGPAERGHPAEIRAAGVTRLSIGAQSLDAGELRILGRRHTGTDVAEAVRSARTAGIGSVSLDLLYDVPGQSLASWSRSLELAIAMDPDHLSIYALTLDDPEAEGAAGPMGDHLPVRPGARRWREAARGRQDDDRAAAMYKLADDRLASAGYEWYEISNWARPGHEGRHNLGYWRGDPWEAVGPGAHAFDGATRRWNAARLDGYLAALLPPDGASILPPGSSEPGEALARAAEDAITRLRTREGLPAESLDDPSLGPALAWALETRLVERTSADRVALSVAGRLLSNELFARLV